jgi:uncharacterized protein
MRLLRAADRVAQPWKNGGGLTREVAVSPQRAGFGDFDWRISIADVRVAGPFSRFEGVDRIMAILDGRLSLEFSDRSVTLDKASAPFAFAGEAACEGRPLDGPVRDLNVMVRRSRCTAEVRRFAGARVAGVIVATAPTIVEAEGGPIALERLDALETAAPLAVSGAGFAIRFGPT